MTVLKAINLSGFGKKYQGKVRDYYIVNDKRILITTDRISAFDRVLGYIPHKGQVLNQLSAFWFEKTKDIIPNHLISVPDPNIMIVKNCQPYPIEIVVRGYISGVTSTSLWYNYSQGKREIYGLKFPEGLRKNQKLPKPIITPTTRGTGLGGHDEKISKKEILERRIISKKIYEQIEKAALTLFERGTIICAKAGLILVDTKYEFGDDDGQLTLMDEIHTPDSSRFWIAKTYQERFKKDLEPENFDKEFFRLWYSRRGYTGEGKPPRMPLNFKHKVSQRYVKLYEMITGKKFIPTQKPIVARIKKISLMKNNHFPRLGIIGGGQLGKMMTQAAKKMGFYVTILDPTPQSPAGQVADAQIIADFNDEKAIIKVAQQSDFLTFEIENTNGEFLDDLEKKASCKINPSGKSWRLFQDKLEQKKLFQKADIFQPKFLPVKDLSDLKKAVKKLKLPLMLKSRLDSYDGRGNVLIKKASDINKAWQKLKNQKLYVEEFIAFDKELAVMAARDGKGKIALYPVVETIQKNNICHFVLAPAKISSLAKKRANNLTIKTMKLLKGAGVFGIEMFKTPDDKVLINEIAPRVHNSGHYTIEACVTSQFEQHVRAVSGLPLGSTTMIAPAAVMVNILGERQGPVKLKGMEKALAIPGVSLHIYGKHETKTERKMGHITVTDKNIKSAYNKAILARKHINI